MHSNESYWAVLSWGAVYYAVKGGFNFWGCGRNSKVWPFKWKLSTEPYFPVVLFIMLYKVVSIFEDVDEILKCNHSNECNQAVLAFLCGHSNPSSTLLSCCLLCMLYKIVITLNLWMKNKSFEFRWIDYLNECYRALFPCRAGLFHCFTKKQPKRLFRFEHKRIASLE